MSEMDAEIEWEEVFLELVKGKPRRNICWWYCCVKTDPAKDKRMNRFCRFLFCCSCAPQCRKNKPMTPREKVLSLLSHKEKARDITEREKVDAYLTKRHLEIQRRRKFNGQLVGSITKQLLHQNSYTFNQFKYEYIYRFFMCNIGFIEI